MMESGSHISYTKTLEEQTLVYLSISPPNLSMMLVWNNLADPHLSAFSDFARFSQTLTLNTTEVFLVASHFSGEGTAGRGGDVQIIMNFC